MELLCMTPQQRLLHPCPTRTHWSILEQSGKMEPPHCPRPSKPNPLFVSFRMYRRQRPTGLSRWKCILWSSSGLSRAAGCSTFGYSQTGNRSNGGHGSRSYCRCRCECQIYVHFSCTDKNNCCCRSTVLTCNSIGVGRRWGSVDIHYSMRQRCSQHYCHSQSTFFHCKQSPCHCRSTWTFVPLQFCTVPTPVSRLAPQRGLQFRPSRPHFALHSSSLGFRHSICSSTA